MKARSLIDGASFGPDTVKFPCARSAHIWFMKPANMERPPAQRSVSLGAVSPWSSLA
jgi:hypothetical protein